MRELLYASFSSDFLFFLQKLSVELCAGFLDAAHGLDDILVAGGVAHAEAFGATEGISADSRHVGFFKEIKCKVCGGMDGTLAVGLAEIA